jgi:hypothetical protein
MHPVLSALARASLRRADLADLERILEARSG